VYARRGVLLAEKALNQVESLDAQAGIWYNKPVSWGACQAEVVGVLEKNVELALLLDAYGALLTEHQRTVARLRVDEDMTFQEIAEQLGISRQAAHDGMRTAQQQLEGYEKALGLVERTMTLKREIEKCEKALSEAKAALSRIDWIER